MEITTAEKERFSGFCLPMSMSPALAWPRGDEPYFALVFVERGTLTVRAEGGEWAACPGPVVLLLRPGHSVRDIRVNGGETSSVAFRIDALDATIARDGNDYAVSDLPEFFFLRPFRELPPSGLLVRGVSLALARKLSSTFRNLDVQLNRKQGPFWPCLARSYLLESLILMERNGYGDAEPLPGTQPEPRGLAGKVYEYIRLSYAEPLNLDAIASRFATNRTDLNEAFRAEYGVTVMACLSDVRMEVARALLRNTGVPISVIASRVGITDESYFGRVFKKSNGMTPLEYRKSVSDPH
jgi:AraC-like DNA-binding protein